MDFHTVKPGIHGINGRLAVIRNHLLNIIMSQFTWHRAGDHFSDAIAVHHPHLRVWRQRGRGNRLAVGMKTFVRHAPHVPQLREYFAIDFMDGVRHQPPTRNLFRRMNTRRPGIPLTLGRNLRGFGDDKPSSGSLLVILCHQRRGDIARLCGAGAGHGGHHDSAFQFDSANLRVFKQGTLLHVLFSREVSYGLTLRPANRFDNGSEN
ncbi:hypothetical protein D3C75_783840 [compost metagenome]